MDPQGAAMMNDGGVYNFSEIWPGFQMNAGAATYGLGLDPMVMDQRSNHSSPNRNSRKRREEDDCAKGGASTSNSNGNSNNNAMSEGDNKRLKAVRSNGNRENKAEGEGNSGKAAEPPGKAAELPKQDYIHVRARRGQATDSHSLAERARREKISERMKILQDLVPGCNKDDTAFEKQSVNIPEKMVNEEDIVETILWHQRYGHTRSSNINMFQNQRMMKPNFVSRAPNPAPAFTSRGAGVGFSLGRGKTSSSMMAKESSTLNPYCSRGGRGFQPSSAPEPSYHVRSGGGSLNRNGYGGRDAYQSPRPYLYYRSDNRPSHQASNDFWQPRSGVARGVTEDWRQNKPSLGNSGRGRGGGRGW